METVGMKNLFDLARHPANNRNVQVLRIFQQLRTQGAADQQRDPFLLQDP
jgi:hypothetical protein